MRRELGPLSFFGWLGKIQAWGRTELEKHLTAHQGVAVALLLGDGGGMTANDWDKYFRTGVVHALAVSGQHLVVLAGFLGFLLQLVRVPRRSRALFITLVLISYAFLTGGRPAAMRAAWMVTAFSGGILCGRLVLPANAFALAWLGVVLIAAGRYLHRRLPAVVSLRAGAAVGRVHRAGIRPGTRSARRGRRIAVHCFGPLIVNFCRMAGFGYTWPA